MSKLFERFLSTPEILETLSERQFVAAMLRFEASLARAQAAVGLIPEAAAQVIGGACQIERFDVAKILDGSSHAGSLAIPLVSQLRDMVRLTNAQAAPFVHFGSTSQDVIDTAMALVTRDALDLIEADVGRAATALLALAEHHAATPMLARTLMQPASVTSFGFKCVGWAAPLVRSLQRLRMARQQALSVQLGGAVGTQAQLQGKGPQIAALMASELQLRAPPAAWHTQRDEWLALACELGLLTGSLGKIAKDIALMSQWEVGELAEPAEPGRGGSSAMPHKQNPVACMIALAAAQRAPQRVAALLACMPQEHERALGNWQAELAEWPGLLTSAHGSAQAMAKMLPGLQVNAARMRANLDQLRAMQPVESAAEWFDPALAVNAAQQTGLRLKALRAIQTTWGEAS